MRNSGSAGGAALSLPRDFRFYWTGTALDGLGTQISALALPLLLLDTGASATEAGAMVTLAGVGALVAGPLVAPFADARSRRLVMIGSALVAALAMGCATATVVTHRISLPVLVGAVLMERVAASCYAAGAGGSVARLVPQDRYPAAVARLQAGEQGALVAGPALAGVLLRAARWLPFLADAVSYLVAAGCVAAIRTDLRPAGEPSGPAAESFPGRLAAGARFVWDSPFLRFVTVWTTGVNFLLGMLTYVTVVALHRADGSRTVGLVLASAGAAGLVGALLAPALAARFGGRTLVVAISWTTVPVAGALALSVHGWGWATLLCAITLLVPAVVVVLQTRVVLGVPQDLQARVAVVLATSAGAAGMAAPGLAGLLADTAGPATADLVCAALLAGLALYAGAARALHDEAAPRAGAEPDSVTAGGRA